jgi:SOS-response transcriptional repressor LexA
MLSRDNRPYIGAIPDEDNIPRMPQTDFRTAFFNELERRKLSLLSVTTAAQVSYDQMKKVKQGRSASTNVEDAVALAHALGTTVDDLLSGAVPKSIAAAEIAISDTPMIDVWNVTASAGNGLMAPDHEAVTERLAFPPDFLARLTKTHPRHLAIIAVKGDSMAPTLFDDDIVMLDTTKCNLDWDGIFVLRFGDALHVKRIARGRGDMIRIISDNQTYHPQEISRSEVHVVGRVIWKGCKV